MTKAEMLKSEQRAVLNRAMEEAGDGRKKEALELFEEACELEQAWRKARREELKWQK